MTEYCFRLRLSDSTRLSSPFFFGCPKKRLPQGVACATTFTTSHRTPINMFLRSSVEESRQCKPLDSHWTQVPKYLLERLEWVGAWKNNPIKSVSCHKYISDFPLDVYFALSTLFQWSSFRSNAFLICPTPCVAWRPCVQVQGTCRVASLQPCI